MSIPRYKINPLFGYLKDAKEGKFCEYRDYLKLEKECSFLKDTISNCMKAVISKDDECTRLKAEVERLTQLNDTLALRYDATKSMLDGCAKEIEEMEAEVERLTLENSQYEEHHKYGQNVITSLREDVERLTKAGDEMAEEIALAKRQDEGSRFDPIEMHYDHELIVKWNAAKEGKPQP
jgi:chromosome segregation ATPase